jgi:DNA-binding HxlR family transcriptional regulator
VDLVSDRTRLIIPESEAFETRHAGLARTGVLLRSLPGISKKMLTQTLRDGGVRPRHAPCPEQYPPAVEYRLTELGRRLLEPTEMLYTWARENADALDQMGVRASSRRR